MTAIPIRREDRKADSTDIPRIEPLSWLGLECVIWSLVLVHLVKWAGNWLYFSTWQIRYLVGYENSQWTVWYGKDFWDRLAIHFQNGLPGIVAVLCGIAVAGLFYVILRGPALREKRIIAVPIAVMAGTGLGILVAIQERGWHVHWFASQAAPQWWITDRHDIRDLGIYMFAALGVVFLFSKPKHPCDDRLTPGQYVKYIALALAAAAVPITIIGVLGWRVTWLHEHGWMVPAHFGALASEVNGWIAAGTWIVVVAGIAGALVAKPFLRRPADDVQWFFAERSASAILSNQGLNKYRGDVVIGTPPHRRRVHWLLDHRSLDTLPARNPWMVRGLLALAVFTLICAGAGAWLTIWGPAAVH